MTEAVEAQILNKSPLHNFHQRLGATMIEREGWLVPESYGDVSLEYAAVRGGGCGVLDLSDRGRILVSGTEAVQFLNGLITNDMKTLAENSWMPAAFPNVQGRLIASVRVVRLADDSRETRTAKGTNENVCPTFLIDTEAATHERVLKTIERFTLAGDFRVTDVTDQTALLSVQGKKAIDVVRMVLGDTPAELLANQAMQIAWPQQDVGNASDNADVASRVTVMGASHTGEHGFDLVVESDQIGILWEALQNAGAQPVGYSALEMLRIEAGVPRYGIDMDETNVVTEALDDAVSYTKGCYIGQEIIARIKYRGHVARHLAGVIFDQTSSVRAGAIIKSAEGMEVGRITSVTDSPLLGRTIALGYLKYAYLAPGTEVKIITTETEFKAQVIALPFLQSTVL